MSRSGDLTPYLTEDERLMVKRIDVGIQRRQYERDVLAPRRAAEEVARQAEAAATQYRLREYARAEHAALVWTGWAALPAEVLRLQRHCVDLALREPEIGLLWLAPNTRSQELVGQDNAFAFRRSLKVVAPPITGHPPAAVVVHEVGHCRTAHVQGRLQREAAAWRWAKEHSPFWDETTQATMVRSLQSYVNLAVKDDVLAVIEVERLCSTDEYRRERHRRLQMRLAAEEAQLQAQLQGRQCQRCERKAATEIYAGSPTCANCAAAARDAASHRAVDERITRLRQERARRGRPRSQSK